MTRVSKVISGIVIIYVISVFYYTIINHTNHKIEIISNNALSSSNIAETNDSKTKLDPVEVNTLKSNHAHDNHITQPNIIENTEYAYVTLLHGIDNTYRYRGYLYNMLVMKSSLHKLGSKYDFIVLIGFSESNNNNIDNFKEDLNLLESVGIKLFYLPRFSDPATKVNFGEMALLKITPWSFTQYKKVQFFDGDIMPTRNMDCFFQLTVNTYSAGSASPLNSGWYLAIPNSNDYAHMKEMAIRRLNQPWNTTIGWGKEVPKGLTMLGGKQVSDWNFNGASLDQGLFTHYFLLTNGRARIIGDKSINLYTYNENKGYVDITSESIESALHVCDKKKPTAFFAHFTGASKPWLPLGGKNGARVKQIQDWRKMLDELNLPVNSTNVESLNMKPPLGYFHANK